LLLLDQPLCSSHSILCFALRATSEPQKTLGKLSFIDLAGSERGAGAWLHALLLGHQRRLPSLTVCIALPNAADTYDNDKQTRLEVRE
jgi:hypothetical protein